MDGRGTIGGGAWRDGDIRMMAVDTDRPLLEGVLLLRESDEAVLREVARRERTANAIERRHLREALALLLGGEFVGVAIGIGWRSVEAGGHRCVCVELPDPQLKGWACTCPRYADRSCVHEWVLTLLDGLAQERFRRGEIPVPMVA